MGAEVHQLMDPLLKLLIDGSGPGVDILQAGDSLFSAIGHVNDQLMIGGVREADVGRDHGLVGVRLAGEWSSPMSLR